MNRRLPAMLIYPVFAELSDAHAVASAVLCITPWQINKMNMHNNDELTRSFRFILLFCVFLSFRFHFSPPLPPPAISAGAWLALKNYFFALKSNLSHGPSPLPLPMMTSKWMDLVCVLSTSTCIDNTDVFLFLFRWRTRPWLLFCYYFAVVLMQTRMPLFVAICSVSSSPFNMHIKIKSQHTVVHTQQCVSRSLIKIAMRTMRTIQISFRFGCVYERLWPCTNSRVSMPAVLLPARCDENSIIIIAEPATDGWKRKEKNWRLKQSVEWS